MNLASYLSLAVAWQGVVAACIAILSVAERLLALWEKDGDRDKPADGPDLVIERFKVWVLPPWLAVTAAGFFNDALSSPSFAQGGRIFEGDVGFIVKYASVAGSVCFLAWGFYKLGRAIPFVIRNRGRSSPERPFIEIYDEDLGNIKVVQMPIDTAILGTIDIDGKPVNFKITYPPESSVPEGSIESLRKRALRKGKRFIAKVRDIESTLRARTAEIFIDFRTLTGRGGTTSTKEVAEKLTLNCIECVFDDPDAAEKLRVAHVALRYSNQTGLGEDEIRVLVAGYMVIGCSDSGGVLTALEYAGLGDEKLSELHISREIRSRDDVRRGSADVWFM